MVEVRSSFDALCAVLAEVRRVNLPSSEAGAGAGSSGAAADPGRGGGENEGEDEVGEKGGDRAGAEAGADGGASEAESLLMDLRTAYQRVAKAGCLERGARGDRRWATEHRRFTAQLERAEGAAVSSARRALEHAEREGPAALLRVLRQFAPLLERPRVESAAAPMQRRLLAATATEMQSIAAAARATYAGAPAASLVALRGLAPSGAAQSFAYVLRRRLHTSIERALLVVGGKEDRFR